MDSLSGVDLPAVIDFDQSPPQRKSWKPKDVKRDRVAEISEGDVKGAVRLTLSDDTLNPPNTETLEILCQKHPIACQKNSSGSEDLPLFMSVFRNAQQSLLSSAVDVQDKARLLAVAKKEVGS